ncbi:MAG: type IV pilus assembly protein PilM [candidate division NC10 bacterium]|nr:type IV pilus assembly protein PilM [candidate division NC10 bacterium]MBI2116126.1 type IV pilus assembly protein PilM [candidate division NC10 bacterium]MBI3086203.1 type IV pilus assembly protein PilM [candidate division NC10 bacterium]
MFGLGRKKETVGLDIGASSVKAVQLKRTRGGYELDRLGIAPLHPETIVDGVIMDSGTVISAIQKIYADNQIKSKDVVVAVSGHSVIVKKIKLAKMKPEELEEAIPFEAEQYVPYAVEDVNLDFQVLESTNPEANEMDVLLVAVKKDIINDYLSIISTAGLQAVVVDVDAFALQNAFEIASDLDREQVVGLVNLGAAVMNINILQGGVSEFTRDSALGGNRYTESIQKMLGLSYEQSETLKLGGEVDGRTFEDARPAIDMVNTELAGEIRRSFDFFRSSSHSDTIHRVILSGGCARLPGLVEFLSENLEIPCEVANPLRNIKADPKAFDPEYLEVIAPQLAVSVGLALRQAGDK